MARTELGFHIKSALNQQAIKQKTLAERMDVPNSYISQIIHEDTKPSARAVERVGEALGLPTDVIDCWHKIALKAAQKRLEDRYWRKVQEERA